MQRPTTFANSLAVVAAAFFVLCRILVAVVPDAFASVAQSWFHGLVIAPQPWLGLNVSSFAFGLVTVAVVSWLFAFGWATVYNRLAGSSS